MTEPDDRAHGALPEGTPDDEALDDGAQPDDENDADSALDDETAGEDAAFAEPEEVAGAAAVASTTARAGRASAASRAPGRGPRGFRGPATPARAQTASDIAVHVDDRASGIFVIGVIAIFVLVTVLKTMYTVRTYSAGVVERFGKFKTVLTQIAQAQELAASSDADMRALAQEELRDLEPLRDALESEIKVLLLPKEEGKSR